MANEKFRPQNEAAPQDTAPHITAAPAPRSLKIFGVTVALVALAGAAFGYYYFFLQKPLPNVSLEIEAPDSVLLGDPFEITLTYTNNSDQVLRNAALSVSFPEGVTPLGESSDQRFWEESLGNTEPGAYAKRTMKFVALTGPQSVKRFDANLRYSVTNDSGSQFRNTAAADVAVGEAVIEGNLDVPQKIMSGQDFTVVLNFRNNSKEDIAGAKVELELPSKLELHESSTTEGILMDGPSTWSLGTLAPNATGSIVLYAGFEGEAGFFTLPVKISAEYENQSYVIWSQTPSVAVAQAPLSLRIEVNDAVSVASPGNELRYRLIYKNNSQVPLEDVKIEAKLSGSMFDYTKLRTGGVFNSLTDSISWNSINAPALTAILPGGSGEVEFTIPLKAAFTIRRVSDKNFSVRVQGVIESPTVPPGVEAAKVISAASSEVKLAGDIALESAAYYYEPTSGISNTGPFPPRVNRTTQFTIHWRLRNSATDMKNVRISAKLPAGVQFTGKTKSSVEAKPVYNSQTGEVSWEIPLVPATRGIIGTPPEAIFQIETTPAVNQLDQTLMLVGDATLQATDAWTGRVVSRTVPAEDSILSAGGTGRVTP